MKDLFLFIYVKKKRPFKGNHLKDGLTEKMSKKEKSSFLKQVKFLGTFM